MKVLPEIIFCKVEAGLKNIFNERSTHIFFLNLLLGTQFIVNFFHTFNKFSYTFLCPIGRTGISSPYPAPQFMQFPTTLQLMMKFGRVRKSLNCNDYNYSIFVMFVSIFTF